MTLNTGIIAFTKESSDMVQMHSSNSVRALKMCDKKQNIYFKLLYSFFNFGYYLGIIPFRFHVSINGELMAKTSTLRKLIVLISWTFSLTHHYFRQRSRILVDSQHSSVLICFNILHALMHALTFGLFYYEALTRQKQFSQMMVVIKDCELLRLTKAVNDQRAKIIFTIIHLASLIGIPVLEFITTLEAKQWEIWRKFSEERNVYTLSSSTNTTITSTSKNMESEKYCNYLEIAFSLVPSLISLPYLFLASFRIATFIYPVISLYIAVKSFLQEVVRDKEFKTVHNRREHLFHNYAQLKALKQSTNEVWALSYFFVLVDHVLWLATDLNLGMKEKGIVTKIIVAWYFLGVVVLCAIASEVSRKMCIFKVWLTENSSDIFVDTNEFAKFRDTLVENGIWIGKTGLYKMDYNFMGQVIVLVITLFIIALQSERTTS